MTSNDYTARVTVRCGSCGARLPHIPAACVNVLRAALLDVGMQVYWNVNGDQRRSFEESLTGIRKAGRVLLKKHARVLKSVGVPPT